MADDADDTAAVTKSVELGHDVVERFVVEGAEPLVDEEGLQPSPAGLLGDDVRETERQRERGEETLAAGQRRGRTSLAGPPVDDREPETRLAVVCVALVGVHERVTTARHLKQ